MVRCKFTCIEKREIYNSVNGNLYAYRFIPVYSGSEENKKFYEATPGGSLDLNVTKNNTFEIGKDYYLDISLS